MNNFTLLQIANIFLGVIASTISAYLFVGDFGVLIPIVFLVIAIICILIIIRETSAIDNAITLETTVKLFKKLKDGAELNDFELKELWRNSREKYSNGKRGRLYWRVIFVLILFFISSFSYNLYKKLRPNQVFDKDTNEEVIPDTDYLKYDSLEIKIYINSRHIQIDEKDTCNTHSQISLKDSLRRENDGK